MATTTQKYLQNPGILLIVSLFILKLVTALCIVIANMIFPTAIVLGTFTVPYIWAVALSATAIALASFIAIPFINQAGGRNGKDWTPVQLIAIYGVINIAAVWLVSRVSDILGLGIINWMVVIALALVINIAQGIAMIMFEKYRLDE